MSDAKFLTRNCLINKNIEFTIHGGQNIAQRIFIVRDARCHKRYFPEVSKQFLWRLQPCLLPLASSVIEETNRGKEMSRKENRYNGRRKLNFFIIPAQLPEEKMAAASLRAQLFYPYPDFQLLNQGKMEDEWLDYNARVQSHLENRTRSEFFRDTKMEFLGMKVTCFLGVCHWSEYKLWMNSLPAGDEREGRNECLSKAPIITGESGGDLVALGTLDVQIGKFLPGERLHGFFEDDMDRGYVFNLCVMDEARRQGIASSLMKSAAEFVKDLGLSVMHCHVEISNKGAAKLYKSLGYVKDQEEDACVGKKLKRDRRLLLRVDL